MVIKVKMYQLHRYCLLFLSVLLISCGQAPEKSTKQVQAIKTSALKGSEESVVLDSAIVNLLMGRFEPSQDSNFVLIPTSYADQEGRYMHKEAFTAFEKMYAAALRDGIKLQIRSAARNFEYQKGIWERKWTGETKLSSGEDASVAYVDSVDRALNILKYSSMPGTSRHHWGTDIDLNAFDNSWFESGEGLKLYRWLETNAHEYGYCRPYTSKDSLRPEGYNEEKWHWSYLPVSEPLTRYAQAMLSDSLISGFMGSGTAQEIEVVNKYILGINQSCIH